MTTPLIKMYTLGHSFIPAPVHAGGLRYHGMAPIVSALLRPGPDRGVAVPQNPVFEAAVTFARAEGDHPGARGRARDPRRDRRGAGVKESGEKKVIAFNLCGHGHFDMAAYDDYFAGKLPDYEYSDAEVERALAELPG